MERTPYGFLLVAAGGFLGAVARHAVDVGAGAVLSGTPTGAGTLVANVAGSFALGLLLTRASSDRTFLFVGTGALSSFTTYSTFVADAVALGTPAGAWYVAVSYATGFAAAALGLAVGGRNPR
ncbi:Camphor resistance CrcB protein [Halorubrum californiense DSM 19288]|uniref:Fluoride-specific ion channel FluC n=1 Tax=Halorubrum californiense DSM 19288 TaxID=1227465 RepID=M0E9W9_9EURY|nr:MULTISPECIES: CrcB family protein [Halorubrum]ELZ43858.1 Camphor resistance CrcB protein [Halorubrum californiense DSM 19288]TKX69307.1 CrcB family protein [Halorubrum sp. GN11GM_10-3_MGM]